MMDPRASEVDFKPVKKVALSGCWSMVLAVLLISLMIGCASPPPAPEPGLEHVRE